MSAVNQAMAPRAQAADQVVLALEAQLLEDGKQQRAAVQAAIQYWERECGVQMESSVLEDLTKSARSQIERSRRQPPSMDSILTSRPQTTDTGYRLGVHLEGLEGTWHRLWGMIASSSDSMTTSLRTLAWPRSARSSRSCWGVPCRRRSGTPWWRTPRTTTKR